MLWVIIARVKCREIKVFCRILDPAGWQLPPLHCLEGVAIELGLWCYNDDGGLKKYNKYIRSNAT